MNQNKLIEDQYDTWNNSYNWVDEGHQWSEFFGGTRSLWTNVIFPKIKDHLKGDVLEIAPGYGRITTFLVEESDSLEVVDLVGKCIEKCKQKFGDRIKYHINDGKSLDMIKNNSKDFVFSWDSFVHIDEKTINNYITGIYNVLKPGGYAFIHHSCFHGGNEDPRKNKAGRSNMLPDLFKKLVEQNNLQIVKQETLKTREQGESFTSDGCREQHVYDLHDTISLFKKAN